MSDPPSATSAAPVDLSSPIKDVRGQYFVNDEVLSRVTNSPSSTPPGHASHVPPASPSRRKQSKPIKVEDAGPAMILAQKGGMLPEEAMETSDSDVLVIDTGSPAKEVKKETPKKTTPKKKKEEEETKENGETKDEDKKPQKRKRKGSMDSENGAKKAKTAKSQTPNAVKKAKKTEGQAAKSPATKKRAEKSFDDVENAMEALFAGMEEGGEAKKEATKANSSPSTTPAPSSTPAMPKKKGRPLGSKTRPLEERGKPKKATPKTSGQTKKLNTPGKLSRQDQLLTKFQGPFVHMEGDASNPKWSNVVNSSHDAMRECDKDKKLGISEVDQRRKINNFGNTSTLSNTYDAKKPDETWICCFCKKRSHHKGMGDLFGPYFVTTDVAISPSKRETDLASKFILGGESGKKKKTKKKRVSDSGGQIEVWFHEDCLCWMPDVSLIGSRLLGLEDAILNSSAAVCGLCDLAGCTVACLRPGCRETAHFPCAKSAGWKIDEEIFEAYCPKHS